MNFKRKHKKQRTFSVRKGKLCPNCSKGKLEQAPCKHKGHYICKTCCFTNF